MLDLLPFDLLRIIQSHLPIKDNHRLALSSRYFPSQQTPTLLFHAYKESCLSLMIKDPSHLMHLERSSLNPKSFLFLAQHGHSLEFIRAIQSVKSKSFSPLVKQDAFRLCFQNAYYPATLWTSISQEEGAFHPIFTSPGEFRRRFAKGYHPKIVMALLEDGVVDPSVNDSSCFASACYYGHLDAVLFLLKHPKVDPSAMSNIGFVKACSMGHVEIVKLLLLDSRIDPTDQENESICIAAENGHIEIVKILLQDNRVVPQTIAVGEDHMQNFNNCALVRACEGGRVEIVKLLLESGLVQTSLDENLALRSAIESGHHECTSLILKDRQLDLSQYPAFEDDLLSLAACSGNIKTVELLLHDDRISLTTDAIRFALDEQHFEIVRLFLKDPRTDPSMHDNYLLRKCLEYGYHDLVRILLHDERVDRSIFEAFDGKDSLLTRMHRRFSV
jgi:ankyrin repeat protein